MTEGGDLSARSEKESDFDLLAKWKAGDAAAGNQLFERHFETVYRFFYSKTDTDAADLVQRTFLACIEARARFEGRSSFRTFLLAIAHHELFAHWRKRRSDIGDISGSSIADLSPSPSAQLRHRDDERMLLEALRSIPLELQIVLELHYWEELSGPELAEVLEIPEGTVRSRLRRAKEALRDRLLAIESSPKRLLTTLDDLDSWASSLRTSILER